MRSLSNTFFMFVYKHFYISHCVCASFRFHSHRNYNNDVDDDGNGNGNDNGENPTLSHLCAHSNDHVVSWLTAFVLYIDCHAFSNATSTHHLNRCCVCVCVCAKISACQCWGWRCTFSLLLFSTYTGVFIIVICLSLSSITFEHRTHTQLKRRTIYFCYAIFSLSAVCCLFVSQFD